MHTMKAAVVPQAGGAFQIVERDVPTPGPGQVLVKVQACGICHSDAMTKEGLWPGIQYPRVPGHEIAGLDAEFRYHDENGVPFVKRPDQGKMKDVAFVKDPDGYWIEIVQPDLLAQPGQAQP